MQRDLCKRPIWVGTAERLAEICTEGRTRPVYIKRGLLKRPIYIYQKRPVYIKRGLLKRPVCMWKETYQKGQLVSELRRVSLRYTQSVKKDLCWSKKICTKSKKTCVDRPRSKKTLCWSKHQHQSFLTLCISPRSKKTCVDQKRPIKKTERYKRDLWKRPNDIKVAY